MPVVAWRLLMLAVFVMVQGCALPAVGPTRQEISEAAKPTASTPATFALVDVDARIATSMEHWSNASLRATFGMPKPPSVQTIGIGDSVQIVIWEVSAGGLFSTPANERGSPGSRSAVIPEQMVGSDGAITVPYARGRIHVAGRTPTQVEAEIITQLKDRALDPQVLVTVTKNLANTVSVIGDVTNGARIPLTTRGDRLLEVIAEAGGTKAPTHEVFLTLTRGATSIKVPMQAILTDPQENVFVTPGDVITVSREPQTFTAFGATGTNAVLPFDASGLTLEQAIGKAGGLNDQRADPGGVYVIRFEVGANYDQLGVPRPSMGNFSEVPVIYRANMRDPNAFFFARRFPIKNKDILFVSNAPAADLQKIGAIISTYLVPAGTIVAVGAIARQ